MKTKGIALLVAASLTVASASALSVSGDGKVVDSVRAVSGFDAISVSSVEELVIEQGADWAVTVSLDSNLQNIYKAEVRRGVLVLGFEAANIRNITKLKVRITLPKLAGIQCSGAGSVRLASAFSGKALDVSLTGSGSFSGTVSYDSVKFRLSGSGGLELRGSSKAIDINVSGAANVQAREFTAEKALVNISGAGSADIGVSVFLDARISGMGTIRYYGNPELRQKISGMGRVVKG